MPSTLFIEFETFSFIRDDFPLSLLYARYFLLSDHHQRRLWGHLVSHIFLFRSKREHIQGKGHKNDIVKR